MIDGEKATYEIASRKNTDRRLDIEGQARTKPRKRQHDGSRHQGEERLAYH